MNAELLVSAMATMSRTATEEFSAEELLAALCEVATGSLGVDGAGVMLTGEDGLNHFIHASSAVYQPVEMLQDALQKGPCADSLVSQEPVVIGDLSVGTAWPEFQRLATSLGIGSVLAIPMLSRGRGWGVLDLYRRQPQTWPGHELQAGQVLADMAVSYLVMAHDRDEARRAQLTMTHRATHDGLTGLPNRALLFDRLEHALASVTRRRSGVAVIFLDLDFFKGMNDAFGHTAADDVLVEIAERWTSTLREGDTLARFAGDEFVLVCEGLPQEPAHLLTERVHALTDRLRRALEDPIRVGTRDVVLTVSLGVAVATDPVDAQRLITEADSAMYTAKQDRRRDRG